MRPDFSTIFNKTISTCQSDESYLQYSVREKMLAWVFTFLQNLQEDEATCLVITNQSNIQWLRSSSLLILKNNFYQYADELIFEGTNSGEIQARPFIANYYKQTLWNAVVSILYFWSKDKSEHKENTDVMVEKTIHFTFDLLAPSAIDSGIDLLQNLFKLRK